MSISGKWSAVVFSLFLVLIFPFIRALMVYLLPCIYKVSKRVFPLKSKELKICWYSGMVRGNYIFIFRCYCFCIVTTNLIRKCRIYSNNYCGRCYGNDYFWSINAKIVHVMYRNEQLARLNKSCKYVQFSNLIKFRAKINDSLLSES